MKTYADVLLHLPVDATLKTFFFDRENLALPADFDWTDETNTSSTLVEEIQNAEIAVRDRVIAGLLASNLLAHPQGNQAMFQACKKHSVALEGLAEGKSDLHRAFWLYVHHLDLFEQATEIEFVDRHAPQAQQHDLSVKIPVRRDVGSLNAFCDAVKTFYKKELGCGDVCVARILDREAGSQLVTVHAKDLAMLQLEFEGTQLRRRIGSPNIHMVLEYSQPTGVARTLIRGGSKYHDMLAQAFTRHLLGVEITAQRIKLPTLDLSALKLGFQVPQAMMDGFVTLQVKSLALMHPNSKLKAEFSATASSDHQCVTELIAEGFPNDNPLAQQWTITAATINLYYAPPPGKQRSPVVTVEVTHKGRLNLHKFDEKLRAQLEGYLVQIGVMQVQQTLSMYERPIVNDSELVEDGLS